MAYDLSFALKSDDRTIFYCVVLFVYGKKRVEQKKERGSYIFLVCDLVLAAAAAKYTF
jgi:hypothetical protein